MTYGINTTNISTIIILYQTVKMKVQKHTLAFTVIADVPIKPADPKRMLFVIGMCLLATVGTCLYSIKDIIIKE